MSKKRDCLILKKQSFDGYIPSPLDNRDYTVDTVALAAQPIPEEYCCKGMKVLNQGFIGSCVAHALATAMGYGEMRCGMSNTHDFSRGFIYGNRKDTDHQSEGMHIRQALKQLYHCGDCQYEEFPFNKKYQIVKKEIEKNKEQLYKLAEPFKIVNYFRCYTNEEIKLALINTGAVVLSINIYESFGAECPLPKEDEKSKGGHAMCLVGWDKTGWVIQNSWGSIWGNKGFLHLPYEYPLKEVWGVTISPDLEEPQKRCWIKRIFSSIANFFKNLFKR